MQRTPHTRAFWEKRLQAIENKGNEAHKRGKGEGKEAARVSKEWVCHREHREDLEWKGVYTPVAIDRESAQALGNKGHSGAPLRKRVRKRMKIQGLYVCDKKDRG
jgi:hypothetical protein